MSPNKILVVEDEAIVALDIRDDLKSLGYEVTGMVADGASALKSARENRPDLVMMDIQIQGDIDGIETAKLMQEEFDLPIIFLTANSDPRTIERAKVAGPFGYILKPFEDRELHTSIEMALYRHRLEQKVKENERWLMTTLASIGDGVIATDFEGRIELINKVAEGITGWNSDEATGADVSEVFNIIDENTGQKVVSPVSKAIAEAGVVNLPEHTLLVRKDGKMIPVDDSAGPIIDDKGNVKGAVLVFRDIAERKEKDVFIKEYKNNLEDLVKERTSELVKANMKLQTEIAERRKAELQLQKSEQQYRAMFEGMHDGVGLVDLDERILFMNQAASRILGYSRDELLNMSILDLITENSKETLLNETNKRINGQSSIFEVSMNCKNGRIVNVLSSVSPYYDIDGKIIGSIGVFTDITELRQAEKERAELKEKLAGAERMKAIGMLAGGVAHDLNNILGPLLVYPELIKEKMPPDPDIETYLSQIENSARRSAEVVQDLLTMARRGRYEMIPTNVNEIIKLYMESASMSSMKDNSPDVTINVDLSPDIPKILGSASHLDKVIMNLIINAYDALPDGGDINIKTDYQQVEQVSDGFAAIEPGKYITVSVSDTGIGIEKEHLKRIFEPFYSRKEMGRSGSGLGLAIVYGVVKDHGGFIDVKSKPGEGTEFIVYLPVLSLKDTEDRRKEQSQIKANTRGSERILVVDDDADQRKLTITVLRSLGYEVVQLENGRQTVEFFKHDSVDLVVLDMVMEPDFDGLDTYREIIKLQPHQKVLIVSGFAESDRVKEAEKEGACEFVGKPFTVQQIGEAIRRALSSDISRPENKPAPAGAAPTIT